MKMLKYIEKLKKIVNFRANVLDFIHVDSFCGSLGPELLTSVDLEK